MSPGRRYLTVTIGLLALALASALIQRQWQRRPVLHPTADATAAIRPRPPSAPPSGRDLLGGSAALGLRPDQRARLEALDRSWRAESARLEAELTAATGEFSRFMDESAKTGATPLAEIERRSAVVRELGAELRERRRIQSVKVADVLDERQRGRLIGVASQETWGGKR